MNFSKSQIMRIVTISIISILLLGCAAAKVEEDARANADAKSCCESLQQLPPTTMVQPEQMLQLQPSTPHFNFGLGLAPFTRLAVEPGIAKLIEIRAIPRMSAPILGGDGLLHYANVVLILRDSEGRSIPYRRSKTPYIKNSGLLGTFTLAWKAMVPENVTEIIVTTSPNSSIQADTSRKESPEMMAKTGTSGFIVIPGTSNRYRLSPYGEVDLRISDAPSNAAKEN